MAGRDSFRWWGRAVVFGYVLLVAAKNEWPQHRELINDLVGGFVLLFGAAFVYSLGEVLDEINRAVLEIQKTMLTSGVQPKVKSDD
jgi:hypothetical protein